MTPFSSVIRKSFGSWTAEPNEVAYLPVVGARNSTQIDREDEDQSKEANPDALREA